MKQSKYSGRIKNSKIKAMYHAIMDRLTIEFSKLIFRLDDLLDREKK